MVKRHSGNSRPHPREVMEDPSSHRIKVRLSVLVGDTGWLGPDTLAHCERVQVSGRQGRWLWPGKAG